ncbi:uncharacterized protein LOC110100740 isoform X2 [Dendrobium catenatum]|uniref:uncharacterized protein LOC110100740 isoform X2 n=1 Tax=Dendrobium catenatum TaxID=906689 RepID=UPI0009F5ED23|nr:uncharacterized protein LOC110100740 isoform X2 [Dendrobium catenatum]XP_020684043.1 uncharacterized protein LOC110100740 isoform X2 [Dendrobium catenatum]XP_020684045.1 uncharacterized protein LOC110100740 isoform X2 [Dendrobium catenatum]
MAPGKWISSRIIANYSHLFAPSTSNNVQSSLKNDASHVVSTANNGGLPMGEASPIVDRPSLPNPSAPEIETTIIASSSNKKRGPNRGVALEEHYRTKGKVSIIIPEGLNRPVGEHHSKLSREAGIIIRNFAPMQVERWEQVSDADKELLLKKLLVKINLSIEESHVKDCVMHTMSKRFSDFPSKAYVHYKKHGGGMLARQKPYKELIERPADWIWLCNFFDSEAFKKKSESNCRNRSMLKVIHRMGTKSLVAHLYDQKLSRIELYKEEFTDKENKWVSEYCQAKYEKMMEIREKIIEDGGIVDETIICAEVLGETSSYIRGLGYGPKPIKKTKIAKSNASSVRETELETSLKVIQEKYEDQSKIIKSQQKTIDWLKMMAEKMGMQPPNDDGPDFSNEENDD